MIKVENSTLEIKSNHRHLILEANKHNKISCAPNSEHQLKNSLVAIHRNPGTQYHHCGPLVDNQKIMRFYDLSELNRSNHWFEFNQVANPDILIDMVNVAASGIPFSSKIFPENVELDDTYLVSIWKHDNCDYIFGGNFYITNNDDITCNILSAGGGEPSAPFYYFQYIRPVLSYLYSSAPQTLN